ESEQYFSPFTFHFSQFSMASDLLNTLVRGEGPDMTRTQWFLFGAVGLGLAIVMYLVFFCPADCQ
ncbi:MAG TPA: hypothetical protein DDY39_05240, partial [Nitrospira sp.]|nr:hypothetical protein [Nitrospira sp.]